MPAPRQQSPAVDQALVAVARILSRLHDPLQELVACRELAAALTGLQRGYAADAARHRTWQEIGDALGMSRQAAWKAYRAGR